jgi:hypothetical protein
VDVVNQPHLVEIVAALKEITARITAATAIDQAVHDLLKIVTDIMPADIQCGMTFIGQGEAATFAASGPLPAALDETRHADGDGPCMEAIRTRDVVLSQNLTEETRWPTWSALARHHGVHSVLSYPFDVDAPLLAALNLYAERPGALTNEVPVLAMLVADHASLLLRVRLRQFTQEELMAQVGEAHESDVAVERAVGIVMAQRGCPPEQALKHLHDAATHLGVGLTAVAERLVRTVSDRATAGATP